MQAHGGATKAGSRMWAPDPTARQILDAVPNALAIVQRHGHLAFCNTAWRTLIARNPAFGDLGSLVTGADHEGAAYVQRLEGLDGPLALAGHRLARAIGEALQGHGDGARLEYSARRPDGEEPMLALVAPLPSPSGPLAVVQHVDVSAADHAADAQQAAVEAAGRVQELEAVARRLRRRIVEASRALHTPITPIRLELHLLQQGDLGPVTDAQRRALDLIARNVQRWAEGEQAFLRMADEGARPPEPLDLAAGAADAMEGRRTQALQQGVRLVGPRRLAPLGVVASPDVVADVLDLFLRHALEASPAGSTVSVEATERDGEALVEVRDSGPGLSPRDVRGAFEPWRGRRPRAGDPADGGLHHARRAIEAAGGRVYAESDGAGAGILLGLAFPLQAAGAPGPS